MIKYVYLIFLFFIFNVLLYSYDLKSEVTGFQVFANKDNAKYVGISIKYLSNISINSDKNVMTCKPILKTFNKESFYGKLKLLNDGTTDNTNLDKKINTFKTTNRIMIGMSLLTATVPLSLLLSGVFCGYYADQEYQKYWDNLYNGETSDYKINADYYDDLKINFLIGGAVSFVLPIGFFIAWIFTFGFYKIFLKQKTDKEKAVSNVNLFLTASKENIKFELSFNLVRL